MASPADQASPPRPGGLFRTKSVEQSIADTDEPDSKLRRELGALDLTVFGVAVLIGAGIFTITARVAGDVTGPAIAVSFVIAAIACGFAGLCYAEFASTVPVAGSAYTFSYATFGEFIAWIIGWDLILEYALGAATVAKSWSSYLGKILDILGLGDSTSFTIGSVEVDWGAVLVIAALTVILVLGIKLSSRVSTIITSIKLLVVLFVIILGATLHQGGQLQPLHPAGRAAQGGLQRARVLAVLADRRAASGSTYGGFGLLAGASLVFFAFIGFDAVSTTAEETKNPQKDLPRGILGSLAVVTVLYVATSLVLVGMVNYTQLKSSPDGESKTLADAFTLVGADWASTIIAVGALAGLTTVVLVLMLGQSRVFYAMSRDGLLPRTLARTGKFDTPSTITIIIGTVCAVIAGFVPTTTIEEMVNIGTLFAFVLVAVGTWVLRSQAAEPAAQLHGEGAAGRRDARRDLVPVADAQPDRRDLDPVHRLDGDRRRHLLRLLAPQLRARQARAGRGVEREFPRTEIGALRAREHFPVP